MAFKVPDQSMPGLADEIDTGRVLVLDFGPRVREARETAGFEQAAMAEAVGVKRSTLAHIEYGETRPSDRVAARIENLLGIQLFTSAEDPAVRGDA